jgi:hypothetical protein
MSNLVDLEIQYQRLVAERNALGDRYEAGEKNLLPQIKDLNARIRAVVLEIESLQAINSSGDIARDDQAARGNNSNPVDPPGQILVLQNGRVELPPDTNTQSNALRFQRDVVIDIGVNDRTRPLSETQAPPNQISATADGQSFGPTAASTSDSVRDGRNAVPGSSRIGVGAASDDRGAQELVSSLNAIDWTEKIVARNNVLSQYASYSYQASLYLIESKNYQRILNTGSKNLSDAALLMQTGGASASGRADFFSLDYYIDKIELKSFFVGRGTRLAHNVKEVKMTVIEPNGISLLQNLEAATTKYFGISNTGNRRNFASQIYLLVIKFYGYDQQGNLVRGGTSANQTSDPNAFVEKFYPLVVTKFGFRIANKAVEYDIQFKAPPYVINGGQGRASIPYNMEFSGKTVKDILAGPDTYSAGQSAVSAGSPAATAAATTRAAAQTEVEYISDPATGIVTPYVRPGTDPAITRPPANANAIPTPKPTVRTGLMQRLNEWQAQCVKAGTVQHPDEYNIEFVLDTMANATIVNPGLDKGSTSMAQPGTAADQKLPIKQSMDVNTQIGGAIAGQQIVQFIDGVLRRSSYVRDQQTQIVDNKTGISRPGAGGNLKNTTWYRIGFKAVPMLDKYDEIRNDYAYKITYTISPFLISQLNSPYFKSPVFRGVHKQYKYWFTGENTEVISYEESLNNLYYIALTNTNLGGVTSSSEGALNINEQLKFLPTTASGQSTQGGANPKTQEPAANAADQLYSPSDLKEANVTIVGDPAWLQQGEAWVALNKNDPNYFQSFLADGTINFDAQQILFEIAFNAPRDYNLATGLAQPTADKLNTVTQIDQQTKTPGPAQFSRIYIAKECTSIFERGKFIQNLKGSLMTYYPPGRGEGRRPPEQTARITNATQVAAPAVTKTPAWARPTFITDPNPQSALAIGTQQILRPPSQLSDPTLSQLTASPVYIQARKNGATPQAALDAARAAFAAGTNNYSGTVIPGIRDTSGTPVPGNGGNGSQRMVKDGNPG